MKITVLCENTSDNAALSAEHGLSLYIETDMHILLFDMGQTALFADNARALGKDLGRVDTAVLSHGHYDHAGGIKAFLAENSHAPLYLNENAFGNYYNGAEKYIGMDKSLADNSRLHLTGDELRIDKQLSLYSCNERARKHKTNPYGLCERKNCGFVPDSFLHEQYLLIEENGKRVLLSGCSHKGVLNILEWFKPDVFVGGFHFTKLDANGEGAEVLNQAAEEMLSYPTVYYTCHCTGVEQYEHLKNRMGERVSYLSTGKTIVI